MVPASWPFWLMSFYLCVWDAFHCSLGGGRMRVQVHPTGFALGQVQRSGCQLRSRHVLWSRKRIYGQLIVLQEGVHIFHYLLKSCQQRGPCILMYTLVLQICPHSVAVLYITADRRRQRMERVHLRTYIGWQGQPCWACWQDLGLAPAKEEDG